MKNKDDLIEHLETAGIEDPEVLDALAQVPRHWFVRNSLQNLAYQDEPLPIGHGQTISQPLVVAWMTQFLIKNKKINKVLEIGTGSGYQAAVLSHVADEVFTIERIKPLYEKAAQRFKMHGFKNIHCRFGDGHQGWPEAAPFDGIIVTAAASEVPNILVSQLAESGRMIIPLGPLHGTQYLTVIERHENELVLTKYDAVLFVPMLHGESQN